MAIKTFEMAEAEDGTWVVRDPSTGHVLIADGRVQDGLWEREAREADELLSEIRFDGQPDSDEAEVTRTH